MSDLSSLRSTPAEADGDQLSRAEHILPGLVVELGADNAAAAQDNARRFVEQCRRARPGCELIDIKLDLGDLGDEIPATVEYEIEPADIRDCQRIPARVLVYSVNVEGIGDLYPFIEKQHRDILGGIVDAVEDELLGDEE